MAAKPTTKSQIIKNLSESTNLSKKDVVAFLDALVAHIHADLGNADTPLPTIANWVARNLMRNPATVLPQVGLEFIWVHDAKHGGQSLP